METKLTTRILKSQWYLVLVLLVNIPCMPGETFSEIAYSSKTEKDTIKLRPCLKNSKFFTSGEIITVIMFNLCMRKNLRFKKVFSMSLSGSSFFLPPDGAFYWG